MLRLAGGEDSSDGLFGANSGELLDPDADFVEEDIRRPRTVTFDGDGDGPPAGQPRSGAPGKVLFHGEPEPALAVPQRRRQSQPVAQAQEQPVADDKERLVVCCLPPDASGRAHGCAAEALCAYNCGVWRCAGRRTSCGSRCSRASWAARLKNG